MKPVVARVAASLIALLCATPALADEVQQLQSPDGSIIVTLSNDADGLHYAVSRKGETIIAPSALGLDMTTPAPFGPLVMDMTLRSSVDETHPLTATKAASARNHFNEMTVALHEADGAHRKLNLVLRSYDDGIAFRYVVPAQPGFESVVIRGERTRFDFPADYQCWAFNIGRMDTSHEGEFDALKASQLRNTPLYDVPLACRSASGKTSLLLAEADLRDYAGLYLRGRGDGGLGLEAQLAYRSDNKHDAVRRQMTPAGVQSPWRVVMMADRAGDLIASNLLGNLNPAPRGDFSWVRPGKAAWDWWNGPYLPAPEKGGMDTPTFKRFIDFAGQAGLDYYLIDEGWSLGSGVAGSAPADADITRTKPGVDMPELVAYAAARKVGLMVWVQWSLLDRNMDAALAQYAAWGLKGIKVDFMDRNDQDMVAFYHRLLKKAAEHHLMVDLHGAYPPTGLNRTWPHFVTQEGVMGAEYNKWSARVTSTHNVTIPYTRMVLGPIDYTPGGFRNRTPQDFRITNSPPLVQTTRGQALAMYVVYDSPLQMVADSPDAYRTADGKEAAGFDFIRKVPASWDETRFVAGEIGEYIVLARRKGAEWYLGAMTNGTPRNLTVPLDFLGAGSFAAAISEDGASPVQLAQRRAGKLGATSSLTIRLAADGGAVALISPDKSR